jgi:hypothetical protein
VVHVGYRLNPPPGWPPVPDGFVPPAGWQPDPSWPAPPPGWQLWLPDNDPFAPSSASPLPPAPAQPASGAGPYQHGAPWPAPPDQRTSGLAIASFVLGLLGLFLLTAVLSVILGIAALAEIRRAGQQRGKGLAIAGIALSGTWTAAAVGLFVLGAVSGGSGGPNNSAAGNPTPASHSASPTPSVNVFSLGVGTCFDNPAGNLFSINSVTAISCTKPHNAQVFAEFSATGTAFPGTAALDRRADNGCNARISGNLDQSKITRTMSLHFIFPRQLAWDSGQRRISCLIEDSSRDLRSSLLATSGSG